MSIKTRGGKRISDPASQKDKTEIRGIDIGVIIQRGKEDEEKEIIILENEAKLKKPIMSQEVISTRLREGVIFYTDEHIEAERAKKKAAKVNDGPEIG